MSALGLLFDQYARLDPEPGHWIETDAGNEDGRDYCRACALKEKGESGDLCTYGTSSEQDSCLHCSKCGKLLAYCLTSTGAGNELQHFNAVKFRRNNPLDRETAYHIARLIDAMPHHPEVVRIAARAIRCMRRLPPGPKAEAVRPAKSTPQSELPGSPK